MKPTLGLLRFVALLTCFAPVVHAQHEDPLPELRGVLSTSESRTFALIKPGDGQAAWLTVGQSFAGWRLTSFRAEDNTLVLSRDGREVSLKLASSTIGTATPAKATLADAEEVLTKMKFDEMFTKLIDQQKKSALSMTQKMLGKGLASSPEYAAFQGKVMDAMFADVSGESMRGDMAKIYSELFTKSELKGLSEFYSTEAGQAMVDKQPELAEKMNDLLLPRIMGAMPKVQKLAMEFAQEQQAAKKKAAAAVPAGAAPAN